MNIKYFVRTIETSKFNYDLDYEEILDTKHEYVMSFINALYKINDYDSVLLEDDLVLCKNFKEEIEKVIFEHPNDVINFFTCPNKYFTSHYGTEFVYNQCTYYPKGLAKILADKMIELRNKIGAEHVSSYGSLEGMALRQLGFRNYRYRPCLVQHIDGISTYNNHMFTRNSIYFKDYLDELNINYDEAYKLDNKEKLSKLLERDRNIWYKDLNINN